jgi:hypothetical protein
MVFTRMMSDYKVEMINDGMQDFYVDFHGPRDSKSLTPIFVFSHFWCFCMNFELYKMVAIMGLCYFCFIFLILAVSTICRCYKFPIQIWVMTQMLITNFPNCKF